MKIDNFEFTSETRYYAVDIDFGNEIKTYTLIIDWTEINHYRDVQVLDMDGNNITDQEIVNLVLGAEEEYREHQIG